MTVFCVGLSSYVCRTNSPRLFILRPPKDLAVLLFEGRCAKIG